MNLPMEDAGHKSEWWNEVFIQILELGDKAVKTLVGQLGDANVGQPGYTNFLKKNVKVWPMTKQLQANGGENRFYCCENIWRCFEESPAGAIAFFALLQRSNITAKRKGSLKNI